MYGHTAPASLCWGSPLHPSPLATAARIAKLIKALADAITSKKNDPLPEWKVSQYNCDPLQRHEWHGQLEWAIDSHSFSYDVILSYHKNARN